MAQKFVKLVRCSRQNLLNPPSITLKATVYLTVQTVEIQPAPGHAATDAALYDYSK